MADPEVVLGFKTEGTESTERKIERLEQAVLDLEKQVKKLSGESLDIKTDPAVEEFRELRAELKRLETSFDRQKKAVRSAQVALRQAKKGIGDTTKETRKLTEANRRLASRGRELIDFSKRLPPELRKVARGLDRVEKEAEQAERAVRKLGATQKSVRGLVSTIGQLRTGVGALVAILGIQQLTRFARGLLEIAKNSVETRRQFDALLPALRGITGSSDLAAQGIEFLDDVSRRLKISTGELVKPYTQLTAALRATNADLDLTDEVFEAVIESGAAFGKTADQIGRVLVGVTQVVGKGVACVDADVQILTGTGWMYHQDLAPGMRVAQHGHDGTSWGALRAIHKYPREEAPVRMVANDAVVDMTRSHRVVTLDGIVEAHALIGERVWIPTPQGRARARFSNGGNAVGVWCPETANGTWLARKGSQQFYTGNSLEEFRQQIGEGLPNAIPALARGLGVTIPEAIALVSSGALESTKAIKALAVGLRELNQEAAAGQLDTLGKNLDNIDRIAERARVAFADGLAPSLNKTAKEVAALETDLVAFAALLGSIFNETISQGLGLAAIFVRSQKAAEESGPAILAVLDGIAGAIRQTTGLDLGEPFRRYGEAITGLAEQGEKAFKGIEAAAKEAALGTAESARDTEKRFRESFDEITKSAEVSAADREQIEAEFVKAIAKVSEESADLRAALNERVTKAASASAEERLEIGEAVEAALTQIFVDAEAKRAEVLGGFVEAAKTAAAARIEAEAAAAKEIQDSIERILQVVKDVSGERLLLEQNTVNELERINLDFERKRNDLLRDFAIAAAKATAEERLKLEEDLVNKLVNLHSKNADAFAKAQERIVKAKAAAVKKRLALEKKARDSILKSVEALQKFIAEQAKLRAESEGDRSATLFGDIANETAEAVDNLVELNAEIDRLKAEDADPGAVLAAGFAGLNEILGLSIGGFNDLLGTNIEFDQGVQASEGSVSRLSEALRVATEAASNLGVRAANDIARIAGEFRDLQAEGFVTETAIANISDSLARALEQPIKPATDLQTAIGGVGDTTGLDDVKGSAEGAGTALGTVGEKAEGAKVGILTMEDGTRVLINTLKDVEGEEAAEGIKVVGTAAEDSGKNVITLADGTKIVVEEFGKVDEKGKDAAGGIKLVGEASEKAVEPLGKLAEAAEKTVEPVAKLATEAEKLREDIIGEDEPGKIEELGVAAGTAKEPVGLLAEPVEALRLSSDSLAVSLPLIAAALATAQPALENILKTLDESPVDLEKLGTDLQVVATELGSTATAADLLLTAVQGLPEPLKLTREEAGPLLELIRQAVENGSVAQLAAGIERIAKAAPEIPKPLEEVKAALAGIATIQESVVKALAAIKAGLEGVAAKEIRTSLADLKSKISAVASAIASAKSKTEGWRKATDEVAESLPAATEEAGKLADALTSKLDPALDTTGQKLEDLGEKVDDLKENFNEFIEKMGEAGDAGEEMGRKVVGALESIAEAARAATAEVDKLTAALAAADVPGGSGP